MNRETLIQTTHLTRQAVVYVRQSTSKQVAQNQESTRRQYQLTETAARLGWPQPRIQVIDDDLGLSGASSTHRTGFQRLVAAIGLGEVGIVLVTEVSRLSRLNSDWHRVIELCAVFETLIADVEAYEVPETPLATASFYVRFLVIFLIEMVSTSERHWRARRRSAALLCAPVHQHDHDQHHDNHRGEQQAHAVEVGVDCRFGRWHALSRLLRHGHCRRRLRGHTLARTQSPA